MVDQIRFFAGAARVLEGRAAGEYLAGHTSMAPARADRGRGAGHPVELPDDDGGVEVRPGDRRRQHRGAQAERHHPGDHAAAGRDRRRVPAAGRAQRDHRRPRRPAGRWSSTRPRSWSPSPGRCGPAWRSPARRPAMSSGCTSSSAARHRWSCSTTPTSRPPRRRSPWPATSTPARTARRPPGCSPGRGSTTTSSPRSPSRPRDAKVGLPDDEDALLGPVNNANQLARVSGFLDRLPDHVPGRRRRRAAGGHARRLLPPADRGLRACTRTTR